MNVQSLATALRDIGIPDEVVAIGGHAEMSWCVEETAAGRWEVFWLERGNKGELVVLDTEQAACQQLLGRLTYSQLLAGVIGRVR